MEIIGVDGKSYKWNPKSKPRTNASKLHKLCRTILKSIFLNDAVIEEVFLPGSGGLYADFYLPARDLIVEVNGAQHDKFTPFFHGDKLNFHKAQRRDKTKEKWCKLNNITLVSLSAGEEDEWRRRILNH